MYWLKGESCEFGNDQQNAGDGRAWDWFSRSWAKLFSGFQASLPAAARNAHKRPIQQKNPLCPNSVNLTWIFYSGFTPPIPGSSAGRGKAAPKAQPHSRRGDLCSELSARMDALGCFAAMPLTDNFWFNPCHTGWWLCWPLAFNPETLAVLAKGTTVCPLITLPELSWGWYLTRVFIDKDVESAGHVSSQKWPPQQDFVFKPHVGKIFSAF